MTAKLRSLWKNHKIEVGILILLYPFWLHILLQLTLSRSISFILLNNVVVNIFSGIAFGSLDRIHYLVIRDDSVYLVEETIIAEVR